MEADWEEKLGKQCSEVRNARKLVAHQLSDSVYPRKSSMVDQTIHDDCMVTGGGVENWLEELDTNIKSLLHEQSNLVLELRADLVDAERRLMDYEKEKREKLLGDVKEMSKAHTSLAPQQPLMPHTPSLSYMTQNIESVKSSHSYNPSQQPGPNPRYIANEAIATERDLHSGSTAHRIPNRFQLMGDVSSIMGDEKIEDVVEDPLEIFRDRDFEELVGTTPVVHANAQSEAPEERITGMSSRPPLQDAPNSANQRTLGLYNGMLPASKPFVSAAKENLSASLTAASKTRSRQPLETPTSTEKSRTLSPLPQGAIPAPLNLKRKPTALCKNCNRTITAASHKLGACTAHSGEIYFPFPPSSLHILEYAFIYLLPRYTNSIQALNPWFRN